MERVRDFSPYELKVSVYDGAAEKRTMLMDGHLYMVKFGYDAAPQEEHPSRTSYVNLPVNEYIGSKVFAASGIPTQDVILGDYKGRSVVACRDFMYEMDPNLMLLHFKQLEISMPGGSSRSKARPDWEFVSQVLDEHDALEGIRARARHRFLQMTCVDALIGNFDRHANNWGFIADRRTADILDLAPVYDCGSSLSPSLSREGMRERVEDPQQMREANMAAPYMAMN
ncbi:oxysterol-binding protein 1, partial [Bifidobacterium longum]